MVTHRYLSHFKITVGPAQIRLTVPAGAQFRQKAERF
jgi:hypothetical protein